MGWFLVAAYVAAFALAAYAYKSSKVPPPSPSSSIDTPGAEPGRTIPVLFGTRTIKATNTVWYGKVSTKPIRR